MKEMCKNFVPDNCNFASPMPNNMMPEYTPIIEESMELAQAYVPFQPYSTTMNQMQSLVCGTIFSDLVVPYCSGWHLYQLAKEV
ncbi:spore coat associated protein CotJA [Anaerotignum sp. MB30-C6]|uniref:spore coat associated protein CotJA n=1 Tax=Anaerotignum sp. MB30-C6 TaxID=3070814 RepID=UPI0027DCAAB4|nr:spore coat associated protein CotJA [Anaerotignum sp. MB30-C6]WMI81622.1 spore coat associated protein CotJA [Anaerotignum sp. MB30-C6]